ncbi:hypothetical protein B484DRAFT_399205 [Ochromonadaceae sp. CCMP2298]|nr:hypothetical protein B484DRAFT_399205 [Ochromonadaceae sp. CCMP2298]
MESHKRHSVYQDLFSFALPHDFDPFKRYKLGSNVQFIKSNLKIHEAIQELVSLINQAHNCVEKVDLTFYGTGPKHMRLQIKRTFWKTEEPSWLHVQQCYHPSFSFGYKCVLRCQIENLEEADRTIAHLRKAVCTRFMDLYRWQQGKLDARRARELNLAIARETHVRTQELVNALRNCPNQFARKGPCKTPEGPEHPHVKAHHWSGGKVCYFSKTAIELDDGTVQNHRSNDNTMMVMVTPYTCRRVHVPYGTTLVSWHDPGSLAVDEQGESLAGLLRDVQWEPEEQKVSFCKLGRKAGEEVGVDNVIMQMKIVVVIKEEGRRNWHPVRAHGRAF